MIEVQKTLAGVSFIDLFAGIGGFRLALQSFGAHCVFSSEWDKYAADVYASNFGEAPAGDITQIDEKDVPAHDILCAGFPCQAFSVSGKQRGFEDSRGTLFFEVARLVKAKQPKVVFLENVKNFATHARGNTLQVVKATMEELGYTWYAQVLNASDYGIPQKRERLYMVCFRHDLAVEKFCFPAPFRLAHHLADILLPDGAETAQLYVERDDIYIDEQREEFYSNKPLRVGTVNKGGQGERIYSAKGTAITLSAYGGGIFAKTGGYLINGRPRRLPPRDCDRLMGYPDSFQLAPTPNQAYKQLGNSVVVDVLQYIVSSIEQCLD
jgi:DNA (cytosine-5)-methyltransferase 1